MKHPHHDLIVAWAADTTRVVQYRHDSTDVWKDWNHAPIWYPDVQYRFKPEPKPDVAREASVRIVGDSAMFHWYSSNSNVRFTFDGETGALKSAEVLK